MARLFGVDVGECDYVLVLIRFLDRYLARGYFTKDAVAHVPKYTQ